MRIPAALSICAAGIFCAAGLHAQQELFAPANDLSFTISTAVKSQSYQQPIIVHYQVENIGRAPIFVPRGADVTVCLDVKNAQFYEAWLENQAGEHVGETGILADCLGPTTELPLVERMRRATIPLQPGDHLDGTLKLDPAMSKLPPGSYRVEVTLYGWREDQFSSEERPELAKLGHPILRGEIPASTRIELIR